jgi:hypothetical protein
MKPGRAASVTLIVTGLTVGAVALSADTAGTSGSSCITDAW